MTLHIDQQSTDLAQHFLRHASKQKTGDVSRLAAMLQTMGESYAEDIQRRPVDQRPICLIPNCGRHAPVDEAMCSERRYSDSFGLHRMSR